MPGEAEARGCPALVVRMEGPAVWVDPGDGREVPCRLRGQLKKRQERVTSLVVVGDEVTVTLLPDGSGVVEELRSNPAVPSVPPSRPVPSTPAVTGAI